MLIMQNLPYIKYQGEIMNELMNFNGNNIKIGLKNYAVIKYDIVIAPAAIAVKS